MRVEGGSVGFQIGASETDVVLLVMNDGGMRHLLSDKFTLGGEATAAAGPVGRDLAARDGRHDERGNAVVFPFARAVRRHLAGRRDASSGRGTNRELYGRDATNREILTGDFKTPAVRRKI